MRHPLPRTARGRKFRRQAAAPGAALAIEVHATGNKAAHARRFAMAHRGLRTHSRTGRGRTSRILSQKRRRPPESGPDQLRNCLPAQARISGPAASLHDEQRRHGGHCAIGGLRRAALQSFGKDGRSGGILGKIPHRHLGTADLRISQKRVDRRQGPSLPLRRHLHLLPQGGRILRKGHPRHLPRPPIRKDRTILRRGGRLRGIGQRTNPHD
mmetsp:Transcript_32615/g.68906  ORF Transcript_32615/g.68906 Transcript_32615/m.68906 type:complete len:212 (-) Transcript_32615:584-1219(-)